MPASLALTIRQVAYTHPDTAVLVEQVQDFYREIYGGPDSAPVEVDEFAPPQGAFFLGYELDTPVAMGGWRFHAHRLDFETSRPAEIKRMYVVKAARGRGYARQVLGHLESSAKAAGADSIVLETGGAQPEAIALYRSTGYHDVPRFGHYADVASAVHLGKRL